MAKGDGPVVAFALLADQRLARERAASYFALLDTFKKLELADELWEALGRSWDLNQPFAAGIAVALGRLDVDDAVLLAARERVASGLATLRSGDTILERGQIGYPQLLEASGDAPWFLFVRQETNVLEFPSIAVVGTREASDEGKARARKLAHLLAKRGIVVTSGLARGIDEAAHRGALDLGGVTVAVLGTPLTHAYPREHRELQDRIGFVGALVSQFPPSATTQPSCFPLRNATMSGLTLGTVVIEAGEVSGALVQARACLRQGRKLFIPRSVADDTRLRWPQRYVEEGAHVFSTVDEVIGVLEDANLLPRR
jgi:DNA processing protein